MLQQKKQQQSPWKSFRADRAENTSLRIAIAAAAPGAGASFVTGLLAAGLRQTRRVTVAELGKPYFYEALDMDRRFAGDVFRFYELAGHGSSVSEVLNLSDGINWALRRPDGGPCCDLAMALRCMNRLPGDVILLDCSSADVQLSSAVLTEADRRIVVVDPLPSRLPAEVDYISELHAARVDAFLAVNKMNRWVRRKELHYSLGTGRYAEIPLLEDGLVYKAEYEGVLPGDLAECASVRSAAEKIAALCNASS